MLRGRALVVLLTLAAGVARADPAAPGHVVYKVKPASRGADVRLRRLYKPRLSKLPAGPLMQSPALVDENNYNDIKAYTKWILTNFPPNEYYYVGVGRTAGPILAMLKNLGPDLAANFPSSSMGIDGKATYQQWGQAYREHIEALIPESVRTGDRKILLIDHSSGSSLRGAKGIFEAYREAGGKMPEMEMASVGVQTTASDVKAITFGQLFWNHREEVAEFEGEMSGDKGHTIHSKGGSITALKRNPKYAEHRRALYERMRRDKDLDDFLKTTFPKLMKKARPVRKATQSN